MMSDEEEDKRREQKKRTERAAFKFPYPATHVCFLPYETAVACSSLPLSRLTNRRADVVLGAIFHQRSRFLHIITPSAWLGSAWPGPFISQLKGDRGSSLNPEGKFPP